MNALPFPRIFDCHATSEVTELTYPELSASCFVFLILCLCLDPTPHDIRQSQVYLDLQSYSQQIDGGNMLVVPFWVLMCFLGNHCINLKFMPPLI